MVCRENKGRSAVMGILKRQMPPDADYRDHEFQSAIHEHGHAFSGADDPSPQEQRDFLRGLRQQVINDPSISDAEKYRQSHKQPGVVTRLDQEIKRLETGRDENGRPLRPEQMNLGKHYQSMKHMSAIISRQQEAKREYHELYARSMGTSVETARNRYNALTSRPLEERENTRISLTDDWRDNLNASGISRKTQADIGQSNEARYALSVMESERQAHVKALPTRPAFEGENVKKTSYITPEEAAKQVKCDTCGQFGHEDSACPNEAEFNDLLEAEQKVLDAREQMEKQQDAAIAHLALKANEGDEFGPESRYTPEATKYTNSDGHETLDHGEAIEHQRQNGGVISLDSVAGGYHVGDGGPPAATVDEWRERMQVKADQHDPAALKKAQKAYMQADIERDKAREAFESKRGPVPQVSSAITETKYNPGSGALVVTRPGYTRKTDGVTMPPKDYVYLMGREEYDAFQSSDSPGRFLSETTGRARAKGGNAGWTPQNEAEAKELMVERQCPTCGQFASMTSGHQCRVPGGRQGEVDAATAERARAARERAKLDSLPVNIADTTKRTLVQSHITGDIRHGRIAFPNPKGMAAARDNGGVGMGGFTAQYLGATVNGRAYTWKDPSTGEQVFTAGEVKCSSCSPGGCVHIDKATDMMANHYGSTRVSGVNPGNRVFRRETEQASDAADWRSVEESYQQIRDRRAQNAERTIANARIDPNLRQAAIYPRDAEGNPTRWPRTYAAPGGREVRVDDDGAATRSEVTAALQERTGRKWITEPDGRGGFVITTPRWRRRGDDGSLAWQDRQVLRETLGVNAHGSGKGYHVPADSSWRHETLSRIHGQKPSVHGARRMMKLSDAPGPDV